MAIAQELTAHPPQGEVVKGTVPMEILDRIRQRLSEDIDARAPPASVWEDLVFRAAVSAAYRQAATTIIPAQKTTSSEAAPATKKSPRGDQLVSKTDSLRSWLDNLVQRIPLLKKFVKLAISFT